MTTTNDCTRCNNNGHIAKYAHVANGVCFKCGRAPAMIAAPLVVTTRERSICTLMGLIAGAKNAAAEGSTYGWLAQATDPEMSPNLTSTLAAAPADVRARAISALSQIGIAL